MDIRTGAAGIIGGLLFLRLAYSFLVNRTFRNRKLKFKDGSNIPGPTPKGIFGNVSEIEKQSLLDTVLKWQKEYGDTFQFWMSLVPFLHINDFEVIKEISNDKNMMYRALTHAHLEAFHNKGIIFSNDVEHHKIHRSVVLKGLMKTSYLKNVVDIIKSITNNQFELWEKNENKDSFFVQVYNSLSSLTLDIIGMAGFSTDLKAREGTRSKYQTSLFQGLELMDYFARRPYFSRYFDPKWKQFVSAHEELKQINMELITKREESKEEHHDFLEILLEKDENGKKFTDDEIDIDIKDLLVAGHETTSNTLAFAFYLLAKHPEAQQMLQEESDSFEDPTYEDANKMKVADAVIKETLRLYPVVAMLFRKCINPVEITLSNGKSISLKEGQNVIFSIHSIHHNKKYFPDPETFNINRWINKEADESFWIPFGLGLRSCVGQRMAMLEAKILLCLIAQKYTILPSGIEEPLKIDWGITQKPTKLQVTFSRRAK